MGCYMAAHGCQSSSLAMHHKQLGAQSMERARRARGQLRRRARRPRRNTHHSTRLEAAAAAAEIAAFTWGRESKKSREEAECSWGPEPRNGMVLWSVRRSAAASTGGGESESG